MTPKILLILSDPVELNISECVGPANPGVLRKVFSSKLNTIVISGVWSRYREENTSEERIIEDDTKEREEKLRPIDCPRCKTRNPIGAKYCFTCSMVLDHKLAIDVQEAKTDTIGQLDSTMMLEIVNLVKKFSEKQ